MTATVSISTTTVRPGIGSTGVARFALTRAIALATVLAAVGTEALTAVVRSSGVRLAVNDPTGHAGTAIAFGACTIMVLLCMIPGAALAYAVRRRAARPVRTWYAATAVLTACSFVPDLAEPSTTAGTRLTLMSAHLVAAAIVVPIISRRLH